MLGPCLALLRMTVSSFPQTSGKEQPSYSCDDPYVHTFAYKEVKSTIRKGFVNDRDISDYNEI